MAFTYSSIKLTNPWMQRVIFVYSFLLSGLAFLFFHYVYMPQHSNIWDYYGFVIMFVPPWLIYGIHELVFYLYSKMEGIKYYLVPSIGYELAVMICIFYGSFSLMLYKVAHIDARFLFPVIFLPTFTVRVLDYRQKAVGEASLAALLAMFIVTMIFVVWIQSLGGIPAIERMTDGMRDFGDTLFTIALYGLFVTMTEALPLRFGNMFAFDGYEAFKLGTVQAIIVTAILFTCFSILMFGGYLQYFMSPV